MVAEQIKKQRKAKGLTVEELAKLCKVKAFTVYRWEDGTIIPPLTRIKKIADALGCTVEVIIRPSS